MRSLLKGEGVVPQIPSRLVISAGIIAIIIAPTLVVDENQPWNIRLVALIVVLLFASVDLIEQRFYDDEPASFAVLFLILRIVLAGLAEFVNPSPLTALLSALIPFNAYFVFGPRTSNILAVTYVAMSFVRVNTHLFALSERESVTNWLVQNVVMIFLLIFARALHRDREQQHYTEQLLADLRSSHRDLQMYAIQVAELAAVEERNRLARDIHDSVGHYLTGVNIQLERARVFHVRDPEQSLQAIQEAKQAAQEALNDVRRSVSGLREPGPAFTLQHSLETLVNGLAADRPEVTFTFDGDETDYNQIVLLTLYRAAQEGLTNIQKHANAAQVDLSISLDVEQARLVLTDDGCGLTPERLSEIFTSGSGFGLRGIRERVELAQGKMTLVSEAHKGTTLTITIPKNPLKLMAGNA